MYRILIAFLGFVYFTPGLLAAGQRIDDYDHKIEEEYREWVEHYSSKKKLGRGVQFSDAELKIVVCAVTGDEDEGVIFPWDREVVWGTAVSVDGYVRSFSRTSRGSRGGGAVEPMPETDQEHLDELLRKLPDDSQRLPPADRRLLVQTTDDDRTIRRVYDRADAPDEVWELIRFLDHSVRAWVPEFEPASLIEADGIQNSGFFSLMPDRRRILFNTSNYGPLQIRDPVTQELLREIRGLPESEAITFSPDGGQAAFVSSYGTTVAIVDPVTWETARTLSHLNTSDHTGAPAQPNARFTPDGNFLILQSSAPTLTFFETATWERVDHVPGIPDDARVFIASPSHRRAVVQSDEKTYLWNMEREEVIGTIEGYDPHRVTHATFSPDESRVALATRERDPAQARITVWEIDYAGFLHELRPFESARIEYVEGLMWSLDGRYVMVANQPRSGNTSRGVSIWNVESGRHRGEFVGPASTIVGMALLPDGRLVVGSTDGKIRFWDFTSAMEEIRAFETALSFQ